MWLISSHQQGPQAFQEVSVLQQGAYRLEAFLYHAFLGTAITTYNVTFALTDHVHTRRQTLMHTRKKKDTVALLWILPSLIGFQI